MLVESREPYPFRENITFDCFFGKYAGREPFPKKKCTRYIYTFNVFENPFFTVVKKRRATENDRTPVPIQRFYTVARPTRATLAVPGINTTNENIYFCFLVFFSVYDGCGYRGDGPNRPAMVPPCQPSSPALPRKQLGRFQQGSPGRLRQRLKRRVEHL